MANEMMSNLPTVTITQAEYDNLILGAKLLGGLHEAGVTLWEGFTDAVDFANYQSYNFNVTDYLDDSVYDWDDVEYDSIYGDDD